MSDSSLRELIRANKLAQEKAAQEQIAACDRAEAVLEQTERLWPLSQTDLLTARKQANDDLAAEGVRESFDYDPGHPTHGYIAMGQVLLRDETGRAKAEMGFSVDTTGKVIAGIKYITRRESHTFQISEDDVEQWRTLLSRLYRVTMLNYT